MGHISLETGHFSSTQSSGLLVDQLLALAGIVASARVKQNAGNRSLQAVSLPLSVDCGLAGDTTLQVVSSPAVGKVVMSAAQPSLGDVIMSKLASIPPTMEDPSVLRSSNIAHPPLPSYLMWLSWYPFLLDSLL